VIVLTQFDSESSI